MSDDPTNRSGPEEEEGEHTLADRILDALVYAPAGALLAALEEYPAHAERGRRVVGTTLNNARVLGQMTVAFSRSEIAKRTDRLRRPHDDGGRAAASPAPAAAAPAPAASARSATGPVPDAGELAIPDFDALSASHVVQRLEGLSSEELRLVRDYEEATRARRTILGRIDQLLAG